MAVEIFSANLATTTVSSGGTDAPSSGTSQSWTVMSSTGFPSASSGASPQTQFHIADPAQPSEMLAVTNVSGTTWTVTRGAEGTTPIAHAGGFTVYQVVTAGGLGSFLKAGNNLSDVGSLATTRANLGIDTLTPSGDVTGATDAAAITAAVAALPTQGGTVTLDASGVWYIECGQISIDGSNIYINAPGCFISAVGAGDMIRMYDSSNLITGRVAWGGGILGMPVLDGTNTSGNSCAFHAGDITQLAVFCQAQNWTAGTTSKGVWLDNQWFWTEQCYGRIVAQSCSTGVQFDNSTGTGVAATATGSFDRLSIDIFINQNGNGDGVTWAGGALAINFYLGIWGNFKYASTVTIYTALRMTGQNANNASFLGAGGADGGKGLFIGLECNGTGTTQPTTITFSGSPFTYINSSGNIYFSAFAQSNNSGGHFQMYGPIQGDPTLTGMQGLQNPSITFALSSSGTIANQWYGFIRATLSGSVTGMILATGSFDNQPITIRNTSSSSTITFAAAGTSNMARGTSEVIAALTEVTYHWDATASLWYPDDGGAGGGGGGGGSGTAIALATTSTPVNVSSAAAPSTGQVLTATSGAAATWQTPSGGTAFYSLTAGTAFQATSAVSAGTAFYSLTGGTASYALTGGTAYWAGTASYALTGGTASYALTAGTASYSLTSGTAFVGTSALTAGTAFYGTSAGTAFYGLTAGTAFYGLTAGTAFHGGTAFYGLTAGTAFSATTSLNFSTGATLPDYIAPAVVGLTASGTSVAVNAALGNAFNYSIGTSSSISNPSNPVEGQVIRFRLTSGGTAFTVTWGSNYDFGASGAPALSITSAKVDIVAFEYVSSITKWCWLGAALGN